jgi:hypothetical protein
MAEILFYFWLLLLLTTAEKGPTIKYRKTPLDGGNLHCCRLHLASSRLYFLLATAEKGQAIKYRKTPLDGGDFALVLCSSSACYCGKRSNH